MVNHGAHPIRLLTDRNPVALDGEWTPAEGLPARPCLLAGAEWARRPARVRTALPCIDGGGLFAKLTTVSTQTGIDACRPFVPARTDQLVLLPGAVVFHGATYCAPTVRYLWREGRPVEATLELRQPATPARPACGHVVLEAVFDGWGPAAGRQPEPGETSARFRPARHDGGDGPPAWAVLTAEGRVDEHATLAARVLTPFAGRPDEETTGLCATRLPGDPFVAAVAPGQPPIALGQAQEYEPGREKTALSLAATTITLSVSPVSTPEDDADAVRLTSGLIRAAASGKVALMRNGVLTVEPAAVTATKDVTARMSLTVEGPAVVRKDLLVEGNAAVKKDFEAGSA
jgi:hypothetical protein